MSLAQVSLSGVGMRAGWLPLLSFLVFGSRCWGCRRALPRDRDFCFSCRRSFLAAAPGGRGLLAFNEPVKGLVACLRGEAMFLGARWGFALAERRGSLEEWRREGVDLVTWAPRARPRRKDGLPLLAKRIAQALGAEARPLFRKNAIHSQHGRDRGGRMNAELFVELLAGGGPLAGHRVLVIDDVDTTGTTLEIAAYRLRKAGAAHVSLFSVATQMMERFERECREPEQESEEMQPLLLHLFV